MKAGRELDALVAEKVMGWTSIRGAFGEDFWPVGTPPENQGKRLVAGVLEIQELVPNYSTDIAAAWEVVEKMRGESIEGDFEVGICIEDELQGWWCFMGFDNEHGEPMLAVDYGDTAPLAICLAALKAKGIDIDDTA